MEIQKNFTYLLRPKESPDFISDLQESLLLCEDPSLDDWEARCVLQLKEDHSRILLTSLWRFPPHEGQSPASDVSSFIANQILCGFLTLKCYFIRHYLVVCLQAKGGRDGVIDFDEALAY